MQEVIHVDKKEAAETLQEIDKLLEDGEKAAEIAGSCFIDLSVLLVKAKRGAYWTERGFRSEQEYIDKVFVQSRAQYYTFLRMGTHLINYDRKKLKDWGRSKCEDLVRIHNHFNGEVPDQCKEYLDSDNKDTFRKRVKAYLDTRSNVEVTERSQLAAVAKEEEIKVEDSFITFKFHGNGIHSVNLALDIMSKTVGSDKSLGYLLELICVNFNSQFGEDGKTGHVMGQNAYIRTTIDGLVKQYNLNEKDAAEMLIGIIAKGIENNVAS